MYDLTVEEGLVGGANRFFLVGQSGAKTFSQVKLGFAPARGTINFAWALKQL